MTDGADADYRRSAQAMFDRYAQLSKEAFKAQVEYGRWIISTLFLIHGSAIAGLLFKANATTNAPPYLHGTWWFVVGIVFALGAAFCAWINFTYLYKQYEGWADHRMLTDRNYWPTKPSGAGVSATYLIAIVFGLVSVACLIAGAFHVSSTWR